MSDKNRKKLLFLWSALLFYFAPFFIFNIPVQIVFTGLGLLCLVFIAQFEINKHLDNPIIDSHYSAFLYQFIGLFLVVTVVIMISHLLDIYFLGINPLLLIWFCWAILAIPFSFWGIYRSFYRLSF